MIEHLYDLDMPDRREEPVEGTEYIRVVVLPTEANMTLILKKLNELISEVNGLASE